MIPNILNPECVSVLSSSSFSPVKQSTVWTGKKGEGEPGRGWQRRGKGTHTCLHNIESQVSVVCQLHINVPGGDDIHLTHLGFYMFVISWLWRRFTEDTNAILVRNNRKYIFYFPKFQSVWILGFEVIRVPAKINTMSPGNPHRGAQQGAISLSLDTTVAFHTSDYTTPSSRKSTIKSLRKIHIQPDNWTDFFIETKY